MKRYNLEFYVIRFDFNKRKVYNFNIFDNYYVYKYTVEHIKEFLDSKITYDELKEKIRIDIQCEEWSRYEYEISVGAPFEEDAEKLQKIDCYYQALPNLDLIVDMCIRKIKEDN